MEVNGNFIRESLRRWIESSLFWSLIGVLLSLIVFTVALSVSENIPFLEIAQAVGSIAIAVSAIVALRVYVTTTRRHREEDKRQASKEYLQESINILERSFDIFTDNGENQCPPRNDRRLWFTTARMFLRYYNMRDRINQPDHQEIVEEHEEYWRVQFYSILDCSKAAFTFEYFQLGADKYDAQNVNRDSIGVIFDFARWYEDTEDPLDKADVITMHAKGAIPLDQHGARDFIEQYEEYFAKIQQRRKELDKET